MGGDGGKTLTQAEVDDLLASINAETDSAAPDEPESPAGEASPAEATSEDPDGNVTAEPTDAGDATPGQE